MYMYVLVGHLSLYIILIYSNQSTDDSDSSHPLKIEVLLLNIPVSEKACFASKVNSFLLASTSDAYHCHLSLRNLLF